jgi:hypothetical protein
MEEQDDEGEGAFEEILAKLRRASRRAGGEHETVAMNPVVMTDVRASRLGHALQQATQVVRKFVLPVFMLTDDGHYESLMIYLQTSSNLNVLILVGLIGVRTHSVVRRILQAASQNPSIHTLVLIKVLVPAESIATLRYVRMIFVLHSMIEQMGPFPEIDARRKSNLKQVVTDELDYESVGDLLDALAFHHELESLMVAFRGDPDPDMISNALPCLLESTPSFTSLALSHLSGSSTSVSNAVRRILAARSSLESLMLCWDTEIEIDVTSMKHTILRSLKTNSSLLHVCAGVNAEPGLAVPARPILSVAEARQVRAYRSRNKYLPRLLARNEGNDILLGLWPLIFTHAHQSMHGTHLGGIFKTLQALGDTIGKPET